jgi:hypothetical protein
LDHPRLFCAGFLASTGARCGRWSEYAHRLARISGFIATVHRVSARAPLCDEGVRGGGVKLPGACPRRRRSPPASGPAAPGRGLSRAHTAPCGRDRVRAGNPRRVRAPARLWPRLPRESGHADPHVLALSPRGAERRTKARADGSAQRTRRFKRRRQPAPPPGSTWPLSRASPAGNRPAWSVSVTAYPPYEYRLPAGLTVCDDIDIGTPGTFRMPRSEGLDHWSSGLGVAPGGHGGAVRGANAPPKAPDGPFVTKPRLLGPCARATTEQPRGQNGHIKNDLER